MTVPSASLDATPIRWERYALPGLVALVLAATLSSITNGFAYDDIYIIVENDRIHRLRDWMQFFQQAYWPFEDGVGLYRPLIILGYAVQWRVGGGAPLLFHLVNVALFLGITLLVYRLLRRLAPTGAAWLGTAVFAVHPVHVEAIANVVGQAELWGALFVLGAVDHFIATRQRGDLRPRDIAVLVGAFWIGLFTKEQVIVLPAVLLAAEVVLFARPRIPRNVWRTVGWMGLAALAYLLIRIDVLGAIGGDIPHPVFADSTPWMRLLMMLDAGPEWVRLLVWPARLYADYSPGQLIVHRTLSPSQGAGIAALLALSALIVIAWQRARVAAFGLAFALLTLAPVTNILVATGIIIAERTLFLPTVGLALVVASLTPAVRRWAQRGGVWVPRALIAVVAGLILAGAYRSSDRNTTWRDSPTVFARLVKDAPLNFKAHYAFGGVMFKEQKGLDGELEWRYALSIFPRNEDLHVLLALKYKEVHRCELAIPHFETALAIEDDQPFGRIGYAACLLELARFTDARLAARQGLSYPKYRRAFRWMFDRADSALVALDSSSGPHPGARRWVRQKAK
ncbi:MAG: hypothetical protein K2X99_03065 [Gemmatimonadaceae bacterium]|nr:hypothetical protein [Gemmatimonadaceae bacterium]